MKPEKKSVRKTAAKKNSPAKPSPSHPGGAQAQAESSNSGAQRPQAGESKGAAQASTSAASAKGAGSLNIPSILLEGDATPAPKASGPGARYALAPEAPLGVPSTVVALPESYGTGRIFLAARDPHWLFASWDLTREEQRNLNNLSCHGHLVLQIHSEGESLPDVHVHPESKTWFVYVPYAETRYFAVIGYYDDKNQWQEVSRSRSTLTPPDSPSQDLSAEFATLPSEVTFEQVQKIVHHALEENFPLVEAILRAETSFTAPALDQTPAREEEIREWRPSQAASLAKLIRIDTARRVWIGSLEVTEMVRRQLQEEVSSIAVAELGRDAQAAPEAMFSISSPFGGEQKRGKKFWFNVNAELIIYGATEPDARVTIADRKVALRPDGTFSFRFALPDGGYDLPAVALSADGEDAREARLRFSRSSDYSGKVEQHPQDPALKPPHPDQIS